VATSDFKSHRNVPGDFDFREYARQCFSDTICEFISIDWKSWLILNGMCGIILVISHNTDNSEEAISNDDVVSYFVGACWFVFACQLLFWFYVYHNNQLFQEHLFVSPGLINEAVKRAEAEKNDPDYVAPPVEETYHKLNEESKAWNETTAAFSKHLTAVSKSKRQHRDTMGDDNHAHHYNQHLTASVHMSVRTCELTLQLITLTGTVLLALYIMHFAYNIQKTEHERSSWLYHLLVIIPLTGALLVMPPGASAIALAPQSVVPTPQP